MVGVATTTPVLEKVLEAKKFSISFLSSIRQNNEESEILLTESVSWEWLFGDTHQLLLYYYSRNPFSVFSTFLSDFNRILRNALILSYYCPQISKLLSYHMFLCVSPVMLCFIFFSNYYYHFCIYQLIFQSICLYMSVYRSVVGVMIFNWGRKLGSINVVGNTVAGH